METVGQSLDILWILICAALVMLMQAGFSCLESGLVRSKNSINVAAKNFADFCLSSVIFWVFGFGLMFGTTIGGLFGTSGFFFGEEATPWLMAFFIFQLGFCGTATTIVSGAVAERMRFGGYLIVATIISGVIYPFVGHWVWASAAGFEAEGWLEQMGFIDFAGSTVVHSVGGWVSLAAIIIIGPRIGRFGKNAVPIHGHDLPFVTLGVFLLWFGWFGFNGGSALGLTAAVPTIIVNTVISGAFGGMVALALSWLLNGRTDVTVIMNGSLAGLVGITASAHIMTPMASVAIGSIAALFMYGTLLLLERFEIDDVVGAVPVHLAAGIWGTLAVAIFADPATWGTELGRWDQFMVQATGVGATFVWAFGVGFILLWLINRWIPLRIDPQGEMSGLNIAEHGASTEILDLLNAMNEQCKENDFSQPVSVEPHTEIGQIAHQYNKVLADINKKQAKLETATKILQKQSQSLQLLQDTATAANTAKSIQDAVRNCLESICDFCDWPIGHCYMVDDHGKILVSAKTWFIEDEVQYADFRIVTENLSIDSGDNLTGSVLMNGVPTWNSDVSKDQDFSRFRVADKVGIKGAVALPILVGEDVVGVLEFFTSTELVQNDTILDVIASVGAQLGRVVERARSEESRFKTVVDNMPASVHLRNTNGQYILVNRKYEDFYGVSNYSVRGKKMSEVDGNQMFHRMIKESSAADREVIKNNMIVEHEFEVIGKDSQHTLTDRYFPIANSSGEVIEVGGVEIDITELKVMEAKIVDAREQAEAANQAKSDFLANMSHELRTPMNAIIGYSEMLAEDADDDENEDALADLNKVIAAGKHLLSLINDVLDLSKIEAGKMELYTEDFDIGNTLHDVTSMAMTLIEKKNNALATDYGENLGVMHSDMTKIRQNLFNLISNAAKFTENGTIALYAHRESRDAKDWLVFKVTDTGIGIPEEKLGEIFKEFAQAEENTTKDYGGTGLGLTLAQRFTEMMGGRIWAESIPGEGSTFIMELPAQV